MCGCAPERLGGRRARKPISPRHVDSRNGPQNSLCGQQHIQRDPPGSLPWSRSNHLRPVARRTGGSATVSPGPSTREGSGLVGATTVQRHQAGQRWRQRACAVTTPGTRVGKAWGAYGMWRAGPVTGTQYPPEDGFGDPVPARGKALACSLRTGLATQYPLGERH